MFRLWGKEFKDNRMLKDLVICDESDDTRTHKIFHALDEICYEFDLSKPLWLDSSMNLNAIHVPDFIRILSLMILILIILKFRSLRNNYGIIIRCWGQKPPTMRILNFFIFLILGVDNFQFILYN